MNVRCVLDPSHQHTTGGYLCTDCVAHVDATLTDIATRYYRLDPQPGRGDTGRPPPGFHPTPPLSLHIVAMRDRRSTSKVYGPDDQDRPPQSVARELGSWARTVAGDRGVTTPAGVVAEQVTFLRRHTDWLAHQPWVDEYTADLHRLQRQLRPVTGDPPPAPVGRCIELLPDGVGGQRYCRRPIYMPDSDTEPRALDEPIRTLPTLRCESCGGTYSGVRIVRLRMAKETLNNAGS